jgi:hypothetical protein
MFRALDAVSPSFNLYEDGSKIKAPPYTGLIDPLIITGTSPVTKWTIILMPFISPCMDPEVTYTILIKVEVCIFYDCMLDIE